MIEAITMPKVDKPWPGPDRAASRRRATAIVPMGFPGYFLVVADFITWEKKQGIAVGPGSGSAAGSIVAYALGITDLAPIPHHPIFERFLNPDRISMPLRRPGPRPWRPGTTLSAGTG
ncbi:hypothetical protein GCM10010254_75460 [Streptomyces chromofuscus]|nr:hypothetical protein GCM10010254_75460 [Streptomyces chromofuscus]